MSFNVNMKKVVIGIVVLLIIGGSVLWFVATKDERAVKVELDTMIKYVQRQALEIAIIEQSSKLADYKQQIAKIKQPIEPAPAVPKDPNANR